MLFFLISTEIQSQKILTKTYKAGIKKRIVYSILTPQQPIIVSHRKA